MVQIIQLSAALAAALLATSTVAHPGEVHEPAQVKRELAERDAVAKHYTRGLSKCAESLKARAANKRAIARRAEKADKLRELRGIGSKPFFHRRDLATLEEFETVNHNMTNNVTDLSYDSLFGAVPKCALAPENTIGPYYVRGELFRSNLTESQTGVPLHLEMQFVDTNTCEPVGGVLADIWAANATGVYSGVSADGEGGLNSTYMRGLQMSDYDGVVSFDTVFPGHYSGRATHYHVVAHQNSTVLSNGSYTGGSISHIGQLFFDESLRAAVEATSPYSSNTVEVTSNDDDMWAPTAAGANSTAYDPFPDFVYLNPDDITDGLLMWISIGVDTTQNYTSEASAAAYLAADGGHDSGESFMKKRDAVPHSNAFGKLFAGSQKMWV
ncbi:hypothetical protein MBLNU459_g4765t1 [Dothideomycetes sp. NU459]